MTYSRENPKAKWVNDDINISVNDTEVDNIFIDVTEDEYVESDEESKAELHDNNLFTNSTDVDDDIKMINSFKY